MHSWQQWLAKNYNTIAFWARKWHAQEWRELLAHLTFYLQKNWVKFSQIPDGDERIKFLQTWMKNNVKWKNSDFNKSIMVNNHEDEWSIKDELDETPYDILAEDMTDDIKQFVIDINRRFDEADVNKILKIRTIYLQLETHDRVLYDLYFTQMLSIRGVAKKLQLPVSSVHVMIVNLRKKIAEKC
jgi:hypothetical protein